MPTPFAFAALATFIGLGTWQIERKAWKEALIETLERRLSAAPIDLPPSDRWARLDPADDEFRRVKFSAFVRPWRGSARLRQWLGLAQRCLRTGLLGVAPARLTAGRLVVVNRGFVPEGRQDPETRTTGEVARQTRYRGRACAGPSPGLFSPKNDLGHNLWFVRDPAAIARAKGWGGRAVLRRIESPQPPGGLPQAGAPRCPCATSPPGARPRRSALSRSCSRGLPATAASMCRRPGRGSTRTRSRALPAGPMRRWRSR